MQNRRPELGRTVRFACWLAICTWKVSTGCQARELVLCTTGEHIGYAAQTDLFDFEGHKLRMVWFESASLIPLPDSGGCDVVRLPAYTATSYILRGVDLQMHTMRIQLRKYFQLVAHPHVNSPHKLIGKRVAVFQATEMHVFILHAITIFSLAYREVSRQELLRGDVVPAEQTVTLVLCDHLAEVESLYQARLVDAQIVPPGGSSVYDPSQVMFTTEELHNWDYGFSMLTVTTRKWAEDSINRRMLQYFTALGEVHDASYALKPFGASSPELDFMVKGRLSMLGFNIVGGEIQGCPRGLQESTAEILSSNLPNYFFFQSGERYWEKHMKQMVDKSIVNELVEYCKLFYANGWSTRQIQASDFEKQLDLRVYDGLEAMIRYVNQTFDWVPGQTPGVLRPPLPLGAWDNWPPPEQARYCSGTVELPNNVSGSFSDGHMGQGPYAPNSKCNWILPQPQTQSGEDAPGLPPVLVEFPLLFLEPMSVKDTVQVVDPRAPHRLLAHFRGQVVAGAVRHAGPLEVKFRSNVIRRLNMMEMEMGFNAEYSNLGCQDDPRGCGEGTCRSDGVCVCPEGRSGVDCSLEHCLGTNVYELQPEETVVLQSNVAATYSSFADCRWEVHPPAECAACVVDVVFTSLQTELGHDVVQVATAPSSRAFWWEYPPNGTVVYTRSDLSTSGLRVRAPLGMAVFVRLQSDEVVEAAGFEATARVLDTSQAPKGSATSNCYDAQGGPPCAERGVCAPGVGEGELGQCICDAGYFGRMCQDKVCDFVNVAPALPTWRLANTDGHPLIARNSECHWVVAPAPLVGNGSRTLSASSVRVSIQEWDFNNTGHNQLTLSTGILEVKLQTSRCISGQVCTLEAQCSSRTNSTVETCNWTSSKDTLEMPPEFALSLQSGINSLYPRVAISMQATFMTRSGCTVVAKDARSTALTCEPKPGQSETSLVFDYHTLDCVPPLDAMMESGTGNVSHYRILVIVIPILVFMFMIAAALVYRNRSLSHELSDLRIKSMRLDPDAPLVDLESPLTKVTLYLGSMAKAQPFWARWLLPKNNFAEQANVLKTMLLEADNVHRPKLETRQLQAEYGQDIVDYLLASTSTRRQTSESSLTNIMVDPKGYAALLQTSPSTSERYSSDCLSSPTSSLQLDDLSREMTEEDYAYFENAGHSYDLDLSHVYSLHLKGTLCFVGLKVLEEWDLMRPLKISRSKMASYLWALEDGYLDNPYHNVYHAADVTNRLATMFTMSGLAEHLRETHDGRVQLLGVVLAAAVHDYGHPGTNNAYAVKTGQPLAKIYNDQAVYENSAIYQALLLADKHELEFMAKFSADSKQLLRVTVIGLVLSTDMSRHFDIVTMVRSKMAAALSKGSRERTSVVRSVDIELGAPNQPNTLLEQASGVNLQDVSSEQMLILMQFALKVADIGHCMLPWDQHLFWVRNLENEFFAQGDLEKQAELPISPLMDRTKPGPTNGSNQAGFFEVIVMPTISLWQKLFPGSADQLHKQTLSNLSQWKNSVQKNQ